MSRAALFALVCALFPSALRAQQAERSEPGANAVEAAPLLQEKAAQAGNGSWLFSDSTTLPAPGRAAVLSRFTFSGGDSPTRPFASNLASRGSMAEVGGEVGLLPGLSVQAVGVQGESSSGAAASGAVAGLRWSVLPRSWTQTQLVVSGGWLHELNNRSNGAWGKVALGWESGALRTQVALHGEHVFNSGRDGMDLMVTAGASMKVLGWLRAGVEYVGQDLEETFGDEAEGGARHLVGPTASLVLLQEKLSLVAGPAVAFTPEGTRLLGRMALSYAF